jgi:MarR-like DNA-binding transcriptional regulator SgrR of sgrS sRNA
LEVKIHILFYGTEDKLRKTAHKLNQVIAGCGLTVSVKKTKSMAFKLRDRIRSNIVIDTRIIEKVNSFNYSGNLISYLYKNEMDIDNN